MSRYLIDSDAFNAMRSLGLLAELCARLPPDQPLLMVGYPANVELNPLQREIAALKVSGKLVVHDVVKKSPAGERMKKLIRQGVDKGRPRGSHGPSRPSSGMSVRSSFPSTSERASTRSATRSSLWT